MFLGRRKFSGGRSYQEKGDLSRQVRNGQSIPDPKEILSLMLAIFASFARGMPIVWLRLCRVRRFVVKSLWSLR
jgi:hypothetical protein